MKRFNPDVHSAVVRNYREAFRKEYGIDSSLSDERIWDITEEWVGLEGGVDAENVAILEQMSEEQK